MREKNKSMSCVNDKRKDTENGGEVDSLKDETPTQKQVRYNMYHVLVALLVMILIGSTIALSIMLTPKPTHYTNRPNILFIIADDLGYNDVGYHDKSGVIRTPYIDRLAKQGVKLTNYYVQSTCTPSRAALFTGRYPFRYGMSGPRVLWCGSKAGLPINETTLPQHLRTAGYRNYLVGKWHLGFASWAMTPLKRGFDYFYGMYGGSATYRSHQSYEGPQAPSGYDLFEDKEDYTASGGVNHTVVRSDNGTFSELLFSTKAEEIINSHSNGTQPFFMVVSYMNPHTPINPLQADYDNNKHIKNENRRKYASLVTSLDYGVERLVTALDHSGQRNNTIIVFSGDNGGHLMSFDGTSFGSSNYPLRGGKLTLWEGGVRVPAFITGPGITGGREYDGLFHISDWFTTLTTMSQHMYNHLLQLDSFDQSGNLYNSSTAKQRDNVVLDIDPIYNQAAIVAGNYKLIVGDPAPIPWDDVYAPLEDNITKYKINATEMRQSWMKMLQTPALYHSNPDKCLNISCMSDRTRLYDLSIDQGESTDTSHRFTTITDSLFEQLANQSRRFGGIVTPLNLMESDRGRALVEGVWTPWLP